MAEFGYFFTTDRGINDGANAYTSAVVRNVFHRFIAGTNDNKGPVKGAGNELEITSTGVRRIKLNTGEANVGGAGYINTTALDINIPVVSATTGHRAVIRSDISNNATTGSTARVVVKRSNIGTTSLPNLTRNATIWEIPLAGFHMSSAGTISSLTDERVFCSPSAKIDLSSVPNLPASIVTSGTFEVSRIPSLPASHVTSGTLALGRIPGLPASRITSGTFGTSRIANLAITPAKVSNDIVRTSSSGAPYIIWSGTQAQYDALSSYSNVTAYIING